MANAPRGRRRAAKGQKPAGPPITSTQPRGRRRRSKRRRSAWVILPVVIALAFGPAAAGWITEPSRQPVPTLSPAPTLQVVEPSLTPVPSPSAPEPQSAYLTFATYNIAKSTNNAVPAWSKRRLSIGRLINESNSDIVALQEATEHTVRGAKGKKMTQWQDVQAMVKTGGYRAIRVDYDKCNTKKKCIHSGQLLFKSNTVSQLKFDNGKPAGGQQPLSDVVDGLHYAARREFSWAYFQAKNGIGPFLAISIHLNNQKSSAGRQDRARVGQALTAWAEKLNKASGMVGVPMVLMGDFNSYLKREPKGMLFQLTQDGWQDAYKAAKEPYKLYDTAYTTSYTKGNRSGWPKKPITSSNPVRIDYVMYQGEGLRADVYAVATKLNKDGTFDNDYRGSDHMMVQAIIHWDDVLITPTPTPAPTE